MLQEKIRPDYKIYVITILIAIITGMYCNASYRSTLKEELFFKEKLLGEYGRTLEVVISNEIKKIFAHKNNDLLFIDNYKECLPTRQGISVKYNTLQLTQGDQCTLIDLSKIREALNHISGTEYIYNIYINDIPILANTTDSVLEGYSKELRLNENYKVILRVNFDNNSTVIREVSKYLAEIIYSNIFFFAILIFIILWTIFFYYKESIKSRKLLRSKMQSDVYIKKNNKFILECYKFAQKNNQQNQKKLKDYFPLPIIDAFEIQSTEFTLAGLFDDIRGYFDTYKEHKELHDIEILFNYQVEEKISIPFAKEALNQILISVIFNLLNFSKQSQKENVININYSGAVFKIESNSFKLNKNVAILASQRVFYDSCNPFILNFNQIIGVLSQYNVKTDIFSDITSKIVLDFREVHKVNNSPNFKVVDFDLYKRS